jgi:Fe-S cluster assembly scaffold protein SufB
LLLNKGARAESIPELEILNDQVRCTHGATVGPLDPEMMFYIRSRGLTESQAVKELVAGFIQATLDKMPGNLGHIVGELVKAKMEECQGG